jgi:hypothetical protein
MTAAALTPRVRAMVVCDEVMPSETEGSVYRLEGVRVHVNSASFPYRRTFHVFMLLGSARRGIFPGWIRVVHSNGRTIRYKKFRAAFQQNNELLPLYVDIANCIFQLPGEHAFEVWFAASEGEAAQKGELPFFLYEDQE